MRWNAVGPISPESGEAKAFYPFAGKCIYTYVDKEDSHNLKLVQPNDKPNDNWDRKGYYISSVFELPQKVPFNTLVPSISYPIKIGVYTESMAAGCSIDVYYRTISSQMLSQVTSLSWTYLNEIVESEEMIEEELTGLLSPLCIQLKLELTGVATYSSGQYTITATPIVQAIQIRYIFH